MTTEQFNEIFKDDLTKFLRLSEEISKELFQAGQLVQKAFVAQYEFLKKIDSNGQQKLMEYLKPTKIFIEQIQEFRNQCRRSLFFNHLSSISEGITALSWVTVKPTPAPFIKEMIDASQFYTNKILIEWKNKDKTHSDWVNTWMDILKNLYLFVKQYHTTGLVVHLKNNANTISRSVPLAPPMPTESFNLSNNEQQNQFDNDRHALFAEINQGETITKNLKKVTPDMQTHKNTALRTNLHQTKFTGPTTISSAQTQSVKKLTVFCKNGKKWQIENFINDNNIVISDTEMNNIVYVFNCEKSTIYVKGKINSITLDSCKKTAIIFDSVVASVEFVNCQSVKMQVLEFVPTILIDKTDGCQIYLNDQSLQVEIISSKSTEMNVCLMNNDDYVEYPIPEQYKTIITTNKTLSTVVVEKKG